MLPLGRMGQLVDLFADALPAERRADAHASTALEGLLARALAEGRAAWPGVTVADDTFVRHAAAHAGPGDLEAAIAALLAADVVLTLGCVAGQPAALTALDAIAIRPAAADAARTYRSIETAELAQVIREKVLVGKAGEAPKLASYAGRAPLASWLRVVAVHAAVSLTRRLKPNDTLDEAAEVLASVVTGDLELGHLEATYAADFKVAFHEALAGLEERDRTLLRMHVLDHVGIDDLCKMHGVHRATAARWLVRIRETLFAATRTALRAKLGLDEDEFESLVGALLSRLDVSLARALGPAPAL